jgi:hypothetical protein
MGQAHLADPGPPASTSHERGGRGSVVWSSERPVSNEPAADRLLGSRVDLGDLQRLFDFEGRENRRQAAGQQCFPGTGPPHHEHVMATGRRDFQSPPGAGQASDHGQIRPGVSVVEPDVAGGFAGQRRHRRPLAFALQRVACLRQGPRRENPYLIDECGLGCVVGGHDDRARL